MARPSRNLDQKLVTTGRRHIMRVGVSGLSLRKVARETGINLAMFVYHFGSKENFVERVLKEEYEEFFNALDEKFKSRSAEGNGLTQFRSLLEVLGKFSLQKREFLSSMIRDLLNGERGVLKFIKANAPRHFSILLQSIQNCQRDGTLRRDIDAVQIVVLCAFSMALPTVMVASLAHAQPTLLKSPLKKLLLSEELLKSRIDFILKGLKP